MPGTATTSRAGAGTISCAISRASSRRTSSRSKRRAIDAAGPPRPRHAGGACRAGLCELAQGAAQVVVAADVLHRLVVVEEDLRQGGGGMADALVELLHADVAADGVVLELDRLDLTKHPGLVAVDAVVFAVDDDFHGVSLRVDGGGAAQKSVSKITSLSVRRMTPTL